MAEESHLQAAGYGHYDVCPADLLFSAPLQNRNNTGGYYSMKLRHFSISQQGNSHIANNINCQDFSGSIRVLNKKTNKEMVVSAIADGVGSADFSEFGSRIAVTTVLDMLGKELPSLQELSDKSVLSLIKKAFQQANENIESEAEKKELPFLLFDTTLTVAVLIEDGSCYVGHIGDDGIVALFTDGTYSMITSRIEGEEANSVIPLSSKEYWTFGVTKKPVAALALMTDGLLDKSVGSARLNNRVFYPFFQPLFESIMETDQDEIDMHSHWEKNLSDDEFRTSYGVTDDITLSVIQIPSALKNVHPVPFDEKKWSKESQQTREEIENALNPTSSKPSNLNPIPFSDNSFSSDNRHPLAVNSEPIVSVKKPTDIPTMKDSPNSLPPSRQGNKPFIPNEGPVYRRERKIPSDNFSGSAGNYPVPSNESRKKQTHSKMGSRIMIAALTAACALGIAILSGSVGYNKGIEEGAKQEKSNSQQALSVLRQDQEEALKNEYNRGKEDGRQEALSAMTETPVVTNTPQPQAVSPEEFVISQGQKGEIVKTIQKRLISKGWKLEADGDFGKITANAVSEFQVANHLPPTGKVDILTYWALLWENVKETETTTPVPVQETVPPPDIDEQIDQIGPTEEKETEKEESDDPIVEESPTIPS